MQSRKLTDLIKNLRSKHPESIAPVEPKIPNSRKNEIFMLRKMHQHELTNEWENYTFIFDEQDHSHDHHRGDKPIVINNLTGRNYVGVIYVDEGSSTDVIHKHFFKQLPRHVQAKVEPPENQLIRFFVHNVWPKGQITLPLTLIYYYNNKTKIKPLHFIIINASSPYNIIFG